MRVPLIARWPGKIPPGGTCRELCTLMDLYPTLARLAGAAPPSDRVIDGKDIWPLLSGEPGAKSPHEAFYYYFMDQLQAVRAGRWKLYLPQAGKKGSSGQQASAALRLYDLEADLGEEHDLAAQQPEIVQRLTAAAERARADLGDGPSPGAHQRPAGHVDRPTPRVLE